MANADENAGWYAWITQGSIIPPEYAYILRLISAFFVRRCSVLVLEPSLPPLTKALDNPRPYTDRPYYLPSHLRHLPLGVETVRRRVQWVERVTTPTNTETPSRCRHGRARAKTIEKRRWFTQLREGEGDYMTAVDTLKGTCT